MASVCKQAIKDLEPGKQNSLIVGVIIDSKSMKTFDGMRTRFNNGNRGVWTFTLRDSEEDTINVTIWGSAEYVSTLSSKLRIGTVVQVINPKIDERNPEDRNEIFVPSVSSPYYLTVNEGKSVVESHNLPSSEQYKCLLTRPIKSVNGLQSLKSILERLEELRDRYVDVMLVVTFVSDVRNIMTRDGRSVKCRNFEATDGSTDKVASLVLWDHDWIDRAASWASKRTVLLFNDAQVRYDNFRRRLVLSIVRKTIIIENPDIPEKENIRNAVQRYDPDTILDSIVATPNPDTIRTVMTIEEISNKLNKKTKREDRLQFVTILKAYVIELDVDSTKPEIVTNRCISCKRIVTDERGSCMNLNCSFGNGTRVPQNALSLNLKVNLKDDTGYLIGCRLIGIVAERALGCSAIEFQAMMLPERAELKWKYLMEMCEVRLHILGPTTAFPNAVYNILSISRIVDGKVSNEINDNLDDI